MLCFYVSICCCYVNLDLWGTGKNVNYVNRVWLLSFFLLIRKVKDGDFFLCVCLYHSLYLFSFDLKLCPSKMCIFSWCLFIVVLLFRFSCMFFLLTKLKHLRNRLLACIPSDRKTLMVFCSWFAFNLLDSSKEKEKRKTRLKPLYAVLLYECAPKM